MIIEHHPFQLKYVQLFIGNKPQNTANDPYSFTTQFNFMNMLFKI